MSNNASYVSVGKPKVAGAIFRAPLGTVLPTSPAASLAAGFVNQGYVSEDGVTNSYNISVEQIRAWGGDVVAVPQSEKVETVKFKLIEAANIDVLKTYFGDSNVVGDLDDGAAINVNSAELPASSWVIDEILNTNTAQRLVIPNGKITEKGDVVNNDNEVIGYELTITCLPDSSGNTQYIYLKRTAAGSVTLNKSSLTVAASSTGSISATTTPSGGTVKWSSDDTDVATVTGGTVTGVAAGSCIVKARVVETGAEAFCAITVTGA